MEQIQSKANPFFLIVGMGATGISIAHYLTKKGRAFHFFDTRASLITSANLKNLFPNSQLYFERIDDSVLHKAEEIYLSPGVAREESFIQTAIKAGKSVVGDIELFLREARDKHLPVVGITGSNGKSTLTTMLGLAAETAGMKVAVGGNLGTPALRLLDGDAELFIIEMSSFQLESTESQQLLAACILNVSDDHMDRYDSFAAYRAAKQRIFIRAQNLIFNARDTSTWPDKRATGECLAFSLDRPGDEQGDYVKPRFYYDSTTGLLKDNAETLIAKDEIRCKGMHNIENALALFAIAQSCGIDKAACVETLKTFPGLPHRCQIVAQRKGVTFINDSKATNTGAAIAAITGLREEFSALLLIAGGDGKGADFSQFGECIDANVRQLVLIGADAKSIGEVVGERVEKVFASDMHDAVQQSVNSAKPGEAVLLSPACASFDMFENFEARGNIFVECVNALDSRSQAL